MIKSVHIKNFRNISELSFDVSELTTVISGKNELGKSNALNAIMWLVTGTILTDKWGSGENDINSIIPKDAGKGIDPEVTIVVDSGTEFTKKYITKYSKDGTKAGDHFTKYYVNGAICDKEADFKEKLYPLIKFVPKLKTKDVNELRLFVDPLYALQKLDAKQLRALLVDLGCSVTDEELYAMGYEKLRPIGNKYLGKWDVARKNYKDTINKAAKEREAIEANLAPLLKLEEPNKDEYDRLNAEEEKLISRKAIVKSNNVNPELTELEKQIAIVQNNITNKIMNHQNDINTKRSNLMMKRQLKLDELNAKANKEAAPLHEQIATLNRELTNVKAAITGYDIAINNNSSLMKSYVDIANRNKQKKTDLAVKLDAKMNSKYEHFVICPVCGTEIPASGDDLLSFERNKQRDINLISDEIQSIEKQQDEFKSKYEEAKKLRDDAIAEKEKANGRFVDLTNEINKLNSTASGITSLPLDMTEVNAIDAEIASLDTPVDTSAENKELMDLNMKYQNLKTLNDEQIKDQINSLDIQIADIRVLIDAETIKISDYKKKLQYQEQLKAVTKKLNDDESTLQDINSLIQKMISMINERATEKTGVSFVMLEENLTNDGVKEVCYATVDGIPFKDVNTATKIKYGIRFIEKLKELLGHNQLPILSDRMEGIDSFDTIKSLTKEQLICTRVDSEAVITIK